MKLRILFVSALFLFLAGAALATFRPSANRPFPTEPNSWPRGTWNRLAAPTSAGYTLAPPVVAPEPTELAIYNPCGCTPMPGCPFPIPWPSPFGPDVLHSRCRSRCPVRVTSPPQF